MSIQTVTISHMNNGVPTVFTSAASAVEQIDGVAPVSEMNAIRNTLRSSKDSDDLTEDLTSNTQQTVVTITRNWTDAGWSNYSALSSEQATAKSGVEAAGWSVTIS